MCSYIRPFATWARHCRSQYIALRATNFCRRLCQLVSNCQSSVCYDTHPSAYPPRVLLCPDGSHTVWCHPYHDTAVVDLLETLKTTSDLPLCASGQVKGAFFTPAGRYVAPRVDDPLDVTPAQQPKPAPCSASGDESTPETGARSTPRCGTNLTSRPVVNNVRY